MDSDNEYLEAARSVIDADLIELYTTRYQEGRNQVAEVRVDLLSRDLQEAIPRALRRARIRSAVLDWLRS